VNIAILVAGLPPERVGGTETQAARLASHLASRHQVTVFTRTSTVSADLASRLAAERERVRAVYS